MLHIFQQRAGTPGNDDGRLIRLRFLPDGRFTRRKVIRIDHADAPDADGVAQRLKIHLGRGVTLQVIARGGVLLMARHPGDGVIQNDDGAV